ncbi:MAG TPA: ATP-binding protein, partial [Gemmatales bacterium]|nr:ATP-binding protein [Gemmatales bacterium]
QQIARLKVSLGYWLSDLLNGVYDLHYVQKRWQVGYRHVEIGLDQTYVNIAHARLRMQMQNMVLQELQSDFVNLEQCLVTLHKLMDLDLALISAAYEAELEKRQKNQAKQDERLASIGQMITGLAHEARNALQRMRASTENLELELESHPEVQQDIGRLSKAQDDLTRLFTEVQNYAAPIVLEQEWIPIRSIAQQAWESLSLLRQGRQADLHIAIEAECEYAFLDPFRVQQFLRNFFENSLAACRDPVHISLDIRLNQQEQNTVSFWIVRDNGPGLSETARQHVFEPFFTTKSKGTGLGMAIAQRVIEAHGGQIHLGPVQNSGAEFRIVLPREIHDPSIADRHRRR